MICPALGVGHIIRNKHAAKCFASGTHMLLVDAIAPDAPVFEFNRQRARPSGS